MLGVGASSVRHLDLDYDQYWTCDGFWYFGIERAHEYRWLVQSWLI